MSTEGRGNSMRKLADVIVKNRFIVLTAVCVIAIISAIMIPKINVVTDMAEYLPDHSSMRTGLDLMKKEFPDLNTDQTIRVMFQNLPQEERASVKTALEQISYVDRVDYELESMDYNKDGCSLFILNTPYEIASKEMAEIETAIKDQYSDYYGMVYEVDTGAMVGVPGWILCLAMVILTGILLVMCRSWIEPLLFLAAIGLAVVINMGTNIFLSGGVSYITDSIASILQLVLSMDYSIILINRYRQEREITENSVEAMKKALTAAFSSITSSAVTTIAGLLALVFMKFKMGADLGIVLAKGVFISLFCIFTVLPALILIFESWIQKTRKKTISLPMNKIGAFSYKFRYVILGVFVIFFLGMSVEKGNTGIAYTLEEETGIDRVFPEKNNIILLYGNRDEAAAQELAEELESKAGVAGITSYGNTIGKKYTAEEMMSVINNLDSGFTLDQTMLNAIYYEYCGGAEDGRITLSEFVSFLQEELVQNETYAKLIGADSKAQIEMLVRFTNADELSKARTSGEIGQLFGINPAMLDQIYTMAGTAAMSIQDFLQLLSGSQAIAEALSAGGDAEQLKRLEMLQMAAAGAMEGKAYSASEMAALFGSMTDGFDASQVELLYTLYFSIYASDSTWTMTPVELIGFITEELSLDGTYDAFFDDGRKEILDTAYKEMEDGEKQLKGEKHSLMLVSAALPEESEETNQFLADLNEACKERFLDDYYLIGNSPMQYEMSFTFTDEMNTITLLTAAAIFIVVAITFRSIVIPLILVLIIQAGVYATISIVGLQGYSIYFLALLIVQCILMGATIDYAILFTNYYREKRKILDVKEALIEAYNGSVHTILTSGLIIILVTGVLGYAFSNPTIGQICQSISKGALCAAILVVFVLPGILAVFDKLVYRVKKK